MTKLGLVAAALVALAATAARANECAEPVLGQYCFRSTLAAFYPVHNETGSLIRDWSGYSASQPLHLDTSGEEWTRSGTGVTFPSASGYAKSTGPAVKLVDELKAANKFTIEMWISTDAGAVQGGPPSRILSLGEGKQCGSEFNFLATQAANRALDSYTRTSRTGSSCSTHYLRASQQLPDSRSARMHVAYTFSGGRTKVYIDGELRGNKRHRGNLSPWSRGFHLRLANEATGDRGWSGEIHKVAVWCTNLGQSNIRKLFALGPDVNFATSDCQAMSAVTPSGACLYNYDDSAAIGYRTEYLGAELGDDSTTWRWRVTVDNDAPHDLSHWSLGLCDSYWGRYEAHEPASCALEPGSDPTTGFHGLKYDCSQAKGTSRVYSYTVSGRFSDDAAAPGFEGSFKGGRKCAVGPVEGPKCDMVAEPPVVPPPPPANCSETLDASHGVTTTAQSVDRSGAGGAAVTTLEYRVSGDDVTEWSLQLCSAVTPYLRSSSGAPASVEVPDYTLVFKGGAGLYTVEFNGNFSLGVSPAAHLFAGVHCGTVDAAVPVCAGPIPDPEPEGDGDSDSDSDGDDPCGCGGDYDGNSDGDSHTDSRAYWNPPCSETVDAAAAGYTLALSGHEYKDGVTTFAWDVELSPDAEVCSRGFGVQLCAELQPYFRSAEPATGPPGVDESTGLPGVRWQSRQGAGTTRTYAISFNGYFPRAGSDSLWFAGRAGCACAFGHTDGPACGPPQTPPGDPEEPEVPPRTDPYCYGDDLVLYYPMDDAAGSVVHDRAPANAGAVPGYHLTVNRPEAFKWLDTGNGIAFTGPDAVAESGDLSVIISRLVAANQVTAELWLTTSRDSIGDATPARIFSISGGTPCPSGQNLMVGQAGSSSRQDVEFRLHTTETASCNAARVYDAFEPAEERLYHVVVTWSGTHQRIYVNGNKLRETEPGGTLAAWDASHVLRLGNEAGLGRDWCGKLHRVAVWKRALEADEVAHLFTLGPGTGATCEPVEPPIEPPACTEPCDVSRFPAVMLPDDGLDFQCVDGGCGCTVDYDGFCEPLPAGAAEAGYTAADSSRAGRAMRTTASIWPSDHAVWLPAWASSTRACYGDGVSDSQIRKWIFDPEASGQWEVDQDAGTVRLRGVLRQVKQNRFGTYFKLAVDVTWAGRTRTPPVDSPKRELHAEWYDGIDLSKWWYYPEMLASATLTGLNELDGQVLRLSRKGPALQEGVGANGKDLNYGASAWFMWTAELAPELPSGCCRFKSGGSGDFNLDVLPHCQVSSPCPPEEPPVAGCGRCLAADDCAGVFPASHDDVRCVEGECVSVRDGVCDAASAPAGFELLDTAAVSVSTTHAYWCKECFHSCGGLRYNPHWRFDPPGSGRWVEDAAAGTATLQGLLVNQGLEPDLVSMRINATAWGRTAAPPAGSPKNPRGSDASAWYYYEHLEGELFSAEGRLAGLRVPFTRKGPALQVGHGANAKNDEWGAATWLMLGDDDSTALPGGCQWDGHSQPSDLNLDLDRRCEWRPACDGEEPPVVQPCLPCGGDDAHCADHFPDTIDGEFECLDTGFCQATVPGACADVDVPAEYVGVPANALRDAARDGGGPPVALYCADCFDCGALGATWLFVDGAAADAAGVERPAFVEAGTQARLTGTVRNVRSGAYTMLVEVIFEGRTAAPPAGGSPYAPSGWPADPSAWYYYPSLVGRLYAVEGPLAGLSVDFTRFGPSPQVGVGANLAGASALGLSFWAETREDAAWGQPAGAEPCQFQGPPSGMLDLQAEVDRLCELHQVCEPPIVTPPCVEECRHSSECAGSFPPALAAEGKVSCTGDRHGAPDVDGTCLLQLQDECPGLPEDQFNETEHVCVLPPCGWNWFCPDCFECGPYGLSPAWALPCGECGHWHEPEGGDFAELAGDLVNAALHHPYRVHWEVRLTGPVAAGEAPPAGSPLTSPYYTPASDDAWRYYRHVHGRVWATEGPLAGLDLRFERESGKGGFQIGHGASLVHEALGGHADIEFTSVQQPSAPGACQFADPASVASHVVVDLQAWCDVTPVCAEEPPVACPPTLDSFVDADDVDVRARAVAFAARSSVVDAGEPELALVAQAASLDTAQLDYPSPASGQTLLEFRSFELSWDPAAAAATFTERRLVRGGGGASATVQGAVPLGAFDTLYVRVRNRCARDPRNVLRAHNLHLVVDGAHVNPDNLRTRWVGGAVAGSDEVLEVLYTGVGRGTAWTLTGETTTSRRLLACDDGETLFEVLAAEVVPRPCEPEKQCPVVVDFGARADGTHFAAGDRLDAGDPLAAYAGLRVHTEFPGESLGRNGLWPMIFDTEAPTGGDRDLGSPNDDFGGPGRGDGGKAGTPGQNRLPIGNAVIISEDNDAGDPDDRVSPGGWIVFEWDTPVTLVSLSVLDVEEGDGRAVLFDGDHAVLGAHELLTHGDNSYNDIFIGTPGVRRLEVRFSGSGAVPHLEFCPQVSEPALPAPCPSSGGFEKESLAAGGTFQLHNHPDGGARPPLYGLRLDGLVPGSGIFTFDFDYPGADMRMRWVPGADGYLHIYGVAYAGRDCGSEYCSGWPHRYSVSFKYHDAAVVDNRLVTNPDPRDGGSVTDLTVYPPVESEVVPSVSYDCQFELACGHRGASGFSGWGFVDHSDRSHIWASAWVFTVGECL